MNEKAFDRSTACGRENKAAFLIFRHCVFRKFLQIKKTKDGQIFSICPSFIC